MGNNASIHFTLAENLIVLVGFNALESSQSENKNTEFVFKACEPLTIKPGLYP